MHVPFGALRGGGEAEVADLELARVGDDEDVVAVDVAVDDGRLLPVEEGEALEHLAEPALDDPPAEHGDGLDELHERSVVVVVHQLRDEDDAARLLVVPRGVEGDDVRVVQLYRGVEWRWMDSG